MTENKQPTPAGEKPAAAKPMSLFDRTLANAADDATRVKLLSKKREMLETEVETLKTDRNRLSGENQALKDQLSLIKADQDSQPAAAETAAPVVETAPAADPTAAAQDEVVADLRRTLDDVNARLKRAEANTDAEKTKAVRKLVSGLLAQVDLIEQVLATTSEAERANPTVKGFEMLARNILTEFNRHGVQKMDITPGETVFDPNSHEAVMAVPAGGDAKADTVCAVLQSGYFLNEKLLRPAKVSVYTG